MPEYKGFLTLTSKPDPAVVIVKPVPSLTMPASSFAATRGNKSLANELADAKISEAPEVFCASRMKIPTMIHEQNAFPGVTNKILSRFVDAVAISFKESKDYFKSSCSLVKLIAMLFLIPTKEGISFNAVAEVSMRFLSCLQ